MDNAAICNVISLVYDVSTPRGALVECFVPGDEYEMNNIMTGKTEKKKGYWDGDVLVTEPVEDKENLPTAKRSLEDGQLVMTNTVKGVTTKRYFKKA